MCSICGILQEDQSKNNDALKSTLCAMGETMHRRGPDQSGTYFSGCAAFQHNRLAIIDVENGRQPMTRIYEGHSYTIVYNGEIYNGTELLTEIKKRGIEPQTRCDTEIVLYAYILFGDACASMLNGIFAFAVYDERQQSVYLARDRFGIKPFFFSIKNQTLVFASEIKAMLKHPQISHDVDQKGLWELVFLSPVRLSGGIFKDILELDPACYAVFQNGKLRISRYWFLQANECHESRAEIIEHTRSLLLDAIRRQMVSDVPICTLLSGGLDSSIISSCAAGWCLEQGRTLSTYSFEYEGNKECFHSSLFQPQSDDDFALYMAEWLKTDHHVLTAPVSSVAELLGEAALARDFPGQSDIDSSLLYFCQRIKERHTVALSGECADEIFGGYPWFYRREMLQNEFFPWIHAPMMRASLFKEGFVRSREGYDYLKGVYHDSMRACPILDTDSETMRQSRLATWLSVNYFMTSLLERKDRMSMAASVEVRVPFADHRILEYVYNVPWEIKFEGGVEKALLRNAMSDFLPEKILNRKKSPYPKTQNPVYERLVYQALKERLARKVSPLRELLDQEAFQAFLDSGSQTWFGQLMAKPQMLAWLLQFDIWAEVYHVNFV